MSATAWKQGGSRGYSYGCNRNPVWPRTRTTPAVTLSAGKVELSARAVGILGDNGVARFREFWSYEDGWNFGAGKALSAISVTRLEKFLERHPDFDRRPSLFLTPGGCLMLGWEDQANNVIELEFTPRGYSLFLAATDEEREFSEDELPLLLEALSQVNANGAP